MTHELLYFRFASLKYTERQTYRSTTPSPLQNNVLGLRGGVKSLEKSISTAGEIISRCEMNPVISRVVASFRQIRNR